MNSGPSAELVQAMYAYYQQGYSLVEVGDRFHYSDMAVLYHFRKHNLPRRKGRAGYRMKADREVLRMYADYQAGLSLLEVAKKYRRSSACVWGRFKRLNLPRRPAGRAGWGKGN